MNEVTKLTDLNPRWTGVGSHPYEIIDGITFDCPHCKKQKLSVKFTPPLGNVAFWNEKGIPLPVYDLMWKRTGDGFENLTLTPSINTRMDFQGHWHGFIIDGVIR